MTTKRKYAAVGTGGRIPMFIDPIAGKYRDVAELVGLCDLSATRIAYHQKRLERDHGLSGVPAYAAADFDRMLREQKPDVVIVCVPDYLHHDYIVRSLDFGADVISEKPMTVDAEKCAAIFDAVKRSGRHVRTTFNYRWMPGATKIRELIVGGAIGNVTQVNFEWLLDTSHGADYFRRWHSRKECSGGLFVHKATHHFDLINWWIDAIPTRVYALGDLRFYGRENAVRRGSEAWTKYPRYATAGDAAKNDPFRLSLADDPSLNELYLKAEPDNGYIRDQNVFRDGISIEDTMGALITYRTGVMANYSLNAYSPREGYRVTITGDGGRIEYIDEHDSHIITGDVELKTTKGPGRRRSLRLQKLFTEAQEIPVLDAPGGHGGGDPLIQEQMFSAPPPVDSLRRGAGHEQGAASVLVGAAANRSMETGRPVDISELFPLAPQALRLSELV